ncbi:MAG: glycerate kinase [Frankiales bacterium]|nr:glycerate kinase [Frankiales bacterium]
MSRVLIAPDKFKGTLTASEAALALATGWRAARSADELVLLPIADGGDGTATALAEVLPGARWVHVMAVDALGRPKMASYVRAGDTAVVELASVCGIAGLTELDPMRAHTVGLGIVMAAAIRAGAQRLIVASGGSASTDGASGALVALGAQLIGAHGILPIGGEGLANLARVDRRRLLAPPPGGAEVLVDVDNPLAGPSGAAFVFGPQKGAVGEQLSVLDAGLRRYASVLGGAPDEPGAGAAGGTGYGLAWWGARLVPGAITVSELIGLPAAIAAADVVVTGEGRFDETSRRGKACGNVLALAGPKRTLLAAGSVAEAMRSDRTVSLAELAGSTAAAMRDPERWLVAAGTELARSFDG